MAESEMRLKLLIDNDRKRVLYAEAGKDCVDFLFSILCLPVSTVTRLLGKQQMPGSVANLYESIETLDESCIQPGITKDALLRAEAPYPGYSVTLLSFKKPQPPTHNNTYRCPGVSLNYSGKSISKKTKKSSCSRRASTARARCEYDYFSDDPSAICPHCGITMSERKCVQYVGPLQQHGFVKEVVTYTVMDDLVVKPMSTISSVTDLLTQLNIKDVGALEGKVVNFGMNEALKLLKASFVSNNVLTDVFLDDGNN